MKYAHLFKMATLSDVRQKLPETMRYSGYFYNSQTNKKVPRKREKSTLSLPCHRYVEKKKKRQRAKRLFRSIDDGDRPYSRRRVKRYTSPTFLKKDSKAATRSRRCHNAGKGKYHWNERYEKGLYKRFIDFKKRVFKRTVTLGRFKGAPSLRVVPRPVPRRKKTLTCARKEEKKSKKKKSKKSKRSLKKESKDLKNLLALQAAQACNG